MWADEKMVKKHKLILTAYFTSECLIRMQIPTFISRNYDCYIFSGIETYEM
jgi:hypothetical protein